MRTELEPAITERVVAVPSTAPTHVSSSEVGSEACAIDQVPACRSHLQPRPTRRMRLLEASHQLHIVSILVGEVRIFLSIQCNTCLLGQKGRRSPNPYLRLLDHLYLALQRLPCVWVPHVVDQPCQSFQGFDKAYVDLWRC